MMDPYDIPGISLDVNWGAGMIRKGLNGSYRGPCERALKICEQIIAHPLFFEPVWEMARVEGDAKRSLAALIMWLARGRPVRDAHDGIRGGSGT